MDDGVAYMVMGEEEMSQATQMVAIDNGDGTQQYAIPVMDPETGQETYMIIDPQTAQVGSESFSFSDPYFHCFRILPMEMAISNSWWWTRRRGWQR